MLPPPQTALPGGARPGPDSPRTRPWGGEAGGRRKCTALPLPAARPSPKALRRGAPGAVRLQTRSGCGRGFPSTIDRSNLPSHWGYKGWQGGCSCDGPQPARCSWKRSIPAPKMQLTAKASAALIPSRTEFTQHRSFPAAKAASAKAVLGQAFSKTEHICE